MGDGLHILYVLVQTHEIAEAEEGKHLNGGLLFPDEFGLDFFQAKVTGKVDNFAHQRTRQATTPVTRVDQYTDAPNMPFPTAKLLVKGRIADDLAVHRGEY